MFDWISDGPQSIWVQNVLCITLASQWWALNKRKGFIIYHPFCSFLFITAKGCFNYSHADSLHWVWFKVIYAMPASPGTSFPAGRGSPTAGTAVYLGWAVLTITPFGSLESIGSWWWAWADLHSKLGSAACHPSRLDPEAIAVHPKCTPGAAPFLTPEGCLQFKRTCIVLWLITSFCLPPPLFSSHDSTGKPNATIVLQVI